MNKRQWQVLAVGLVAALLVPVVGTQHYNPPILAGPPVTFHSGRHTGQTAQTVIDGSISGWAVGSSLGVALLTGAAVYINRTQGVA